MTSIPRGPLSDLDRAYVQRTKQLRKDRGFTQVRMAELLGAGYEAYKQYEKRSPMPRRYVDRFCALVGCSIEYLLTGRDSGPRPRHQRPTAD